MKITLIFLFAIICSSTFSQNYSNVFEFAQGKTKPTDGEVTIHQSEEIFKVVNDHTYKIAHSKTIIGYRVRIFSNSSSNARELANEQKSKFLSKYPEMSTYLEYDAPFFKLYVGDFRQKHEALKLLNEIKYQFPSAFIVNTHIKLPKLD